MEEPSSSKEPIKNSTSNFSSLSSDLTELVLSLLPIPSIIRASAVCKLWHSIATSPTFSAAFSAVQKKPFFFLYGQNNIFPKNNQFFAFDPESNRWLKLPVSNEPNDSSLNGCNGYFFCITFTKFSFSPIFSRVMHATCSVKFPRLNPLVGVFFMESKLPRFIVVGGVKFIGVLVDIEDRLAVEIYNPLFDCWEICPPLPADFRPGNSSKQSLSSALFNEKFYVFGIYSGFVSMFDLNKYVWSEVQTLRPPGVLFSFLISCNEQLVLAGLCNGPRGMSFNLWEIDEKTMEFSEMAVMPCEMLFSLFDGDEDDKFASLKCVGLGDLVYVFNEEHHRSYPACVCQVSGSPGKCSWRRIPDLPVPLNHFHKVITFCSTVSLDNILRPGNIELGSGQAIY